MKAALPIGVALGLLLVGAVVNGYWTDRWGASYGDEQLQDYVARMKTVPKKFGDWEGKDQESNEENEMQLKAAHIVYAVQRNYTNTKTGQSVSVFLATGPQRHLAIHTPNSCFVAAGYVQTEAELQFPVEIEPEHGVGEPMKAEFYTARFRKDESAGSDYIRILWSWNAGNGWLAPDTPKMTFAWEKALYKLYIMGQVQERGDDLRTDPRVQFVREFIPVLDKALEMPGGVEPTEGGAAAAPAPTS